MELQPFNGMVSFHDNMDAKKCVTFVYKTIKQHCSLYINQFRTNSMQRLSSNFCFQTVQFMSIPYLMATFFWLSHAIICPH